ncbi:ATP-binding protein [Acidobacteriota bacterium]
MLENLKIAAQRQKRLLAIFFLTIFLPSITLSVFGLRAIRNERFRLAEQIENDHRRIAELIISQVAARLDDIDLSLQSLVSHPSLQNKVFPEIQELISSRFGDESLVGQVILLNKNEEPIFPLLQSLVSSRANPPPVLTQNQKAVLSEAEDNEYKQKNYRRAISLYEGMFTSAQSVSFKAEMLSNKARCLIRLGLFTRAIQSYTQVREEFPTAISSSGLPLGLTSGLQIMVCYQELSDLQKFLESGIVLYRDILQKPWNLTKDQFNLYSSMVEDEVKEALAQSQNESEWASVEADFRELKQLHLKHSEDRRKVEDIKQSIVPEMERMLDSPSIDFQSPIHRSLLMNGEDFFLAGFWIPESNSGSEQRGMLVVEIDNENFKKEILETILSPYLERGDMNLIVSSLQGVELVGKKDPIYSVATTTSFFVGNFPPWKIEFFREKEESGNLKSLSRSFYFWTILTLLLILTFGAVLIFRTLSQEMEILKIKSDFVSSVSHELKTPLTSIKALIERLKEGKVKDSEKMMEYFSIISHDTEKLTLLVKNILDFSKIEEGKMQYEFEEMDISQLVSQQIESFQQDEIHKDVRILAHMKENIPFIQADGDALARAVNNLINNAIKFSFNNPEISVDVTCEENNIKISVKDSGIGIQNYEIDKIFDKFYQGKNAHRLTVKGTGLGLTLVKHITDAHGGRVSVESDVNKGSTFSIILPLKR